MRGEISSSRFLQDFKKRIAQRMCTWSNRDAELDKERADLIDGRCAPRHQPGANSMEGLQIELLLALLPA
jgi:hypothetical protein